MLKRGSLCNKNNIFHTEETKEKIVGNLAAVDGFSVHAKAKSEFIRRSLLEKGFRLPHNPSHVMDLVYK